jgi:hypothetical protein
MQSAALTGRWFKASLAANVRMSMDINVSFERPEDGPKAGPVTVGWFLTSDKGAVLYDPPERLIFRQTNKAHGFGRDDKGKGHLINRAGVASPVRGNKLNELLTLVNEAEWRYPDRPTVQMGLPYCFIADELVYINQIGTFAHYRPNPLPGTIFGGRFPLNAWPRPLMWAFEWHEPEKDIVLRRGEPLFYCQFEAEGPDRPVQMVEAERTPELQKYMEQIGGVVNYVNQTFSLFKAAEALRPPKLLTPKRP